MYKDIHIARIGANAVIIAAIIGGLFTIISTIIENDKLKNQYEELQLKNSELIIQQKSLQEKNTNLEYKYNDLNETYILLQNEFEILQNDYMLLSSPNNEANEDNDLINENNQEEIDKIIKRINEFRDWNTIKKYDEFIYLEQDLYEIELMYKLFLSEEYYKYKNIMSAFEQYGVNCKELSINEHILELWDIEILYIYYNIYNNIEENETKSYSFDTYKMKEIDSFNYKGHGMIYTDDTYEFIYKDLERRINKIIRKMNRNSLPIDRYELLKDTD